MAPYLLHFKIMQCAKARGCDWYDLWGVAPQGATHDQWENISVFKRKFGGMELNLVPTLDYIYDRGAYEQYVQCARDAAAA
jgi:lipid II:glycine glycyltransferase (peptidoglycan interpeptide bridge formation enzyme)